MRPVRPLTQADVPALREHLLRGFPVDAFLLNALSESGAAGFGGAFGGAEGTELRAVVYERNGAVSASSHSTTDGLVRLSPLLRSRGGWASIIGPERSCGALVSLLAGQTAPRVNRLQAFMACETPWEGDERADALRPAQPEEVHELVPLVAAYRREDGLTTGDRESLDWIARHVAERVRTGAIHVLRIDGRIAYTGSFNFRGPAAAGLGGIYTTPEFRGKGIGASCTARLTAHALRTTEIVTLHVAIDNPTAMRCYLRAGFRREDTFRLAFR